MWQKRCGSSGVAAAAGGSSGQGRPWVVNQMVARAFVRVRRPGALTFAAITYQRGRSGRGLPPARTRVRDRTMAHRAATRARPLPLAAASRARNVQRSNRADRTYRYRAVGPVCSAAV